MQKKDSEKWSIYIYIEEKSLMTIFLNSAILQILQSCYAWKNRACCILIHNFLELGKICVSKVCCKLRSTVKCS